MVAKFNDSLMTSLLLKTIALLCLTMMIGACAPNLSTVKTETLIKPKVASVDTVVVIYNHGTRNPRKKERCKSSHNQVPQSLSELANDRFIIYYLCSNATEGSDRSQAGNQVYARMYEIEQVMDKLIKQGILPEHIFLAGHSKGAWVSLMLMNQVNRKFNAAILFAPALANRKSINNYPWWRNEVRPKQIRQMLGTENIEALIFAYDDDEYNRPQDLLFLTDHDPDSVIIMSYRCDYPYTHNTHLHDCRHQQTKNLISQYIRNQIRALIEG